MSFTVNRAPATRRGRRLAVACIAAALAVGAGPAGLLASADAANNPYLVCPPDDNYCYDTSSSGGGYSTGGGTAPAGGSSSSSGGGAPDAGGGGSSSSSSGGNRGRDEQHYAACMERRDLVCDAAGVVGTIEGGPAVGFIIRQTCRLAYKEACEVDSQP